MPLAIVHLLRLTAAAFAWVVVAHFGAVLEARELAPPLLEERFAYPDGPLVFGANSPWRRQQGDANIVVSAQAAVIGPGDGSEAYITQRFIPANARTEPPKAVEASFSMQLVSTHDHGRLERGAVGVVMQFASPNAQQRRGRLLYRVIADDQYQLGVTSRHSNDVRWSSFYLTSQLEYRIVLAYDETTGGTRAWVDIDPGAPLGEPLVETFDPDTASPARVSLQLNPAMGPHLIIVDDLVVRAL